MNASLRRWLQIHLLTAVIVMLTAGVLLGANMQRRAITQSGINKYAAVRGWPLPAVTYSEWSEISFGGGEWAGLGRPPPRFEIVPDQFAEIDSGDSPKYHTGSIAIDAGIFLGALVLIALISECLIRWRDLPKTRAWYRPHRATQFIFIAIAALFLFLNLRAEISIPYGHDFPEHINRLYGWPCTVYRDYSSNPFLRRQSGADSLGASTNFGVLMSILLISGLFAEYSIRRRAAK